MKKQQSGFVLVLTLLIISLAVSVTTFIMYRTTMFVPYAKIAMRQQKAQLLAMSGVQLAISELSALKKPEEQAKEGEPPPKVDELPPPKLLVASPSPRCISYKAITSSTNGMVVCGILSPVKLVFTLCGLILCLTSLIK